MPTKTSSTKTSAKKSVVQKATPTKVVKQASVVKATAKKTAKKTSAGKSLVYADNNTSFWLADGQILNSLVALRDALSTMEKAIFSQHVSAGKNDFANWVESVLDDTACAAELRKAKTPATAKTVVVKHLKIYTF